MNIEQLKPSDVLGQITDIDCTLAQLILSGYNLREGGRSDEALQAVKYEWDHADSRTDVFLAKEEERYIGSLTLISWHDRPDDKRGGLFFPKLRELDPAMAGRMTSVNPLVCDVAGVVVHPDYRGQGVASKLLDVAINQLSPAIIEGQTKTVGAVMARSKLDRLGYRTFYGGVEVTASHPNPNSQEHLLLHQAMRFAREVDQTHPEGLVHLYEGGIAPTIPNTGKYPPIIQTAFEPVIRTQQRVGLDGKTVMAFLLSVKQELFADTII